MGKNLSRKQGFRIDQQMGILLITGVADKSTPIG